MRESNIFRYSGNLGATIFFQNNYVWHTFVIIKKYFSTRERKHVETVEVQVTPLAPDLALMTSEEQGEMSLKSGKSIKSDHVFTMIWKKELNGWKIIHSHESWMDDKVK